MTISWKRKLNLNLDYQLESNFDSFCLIQNRVWVIIGN